MREDKVFGHWGTRSGMNEKDLRFIRDLVYNFWYQRKWFAKISQEDAYCFAKEALADWLDKPIACCGAEPFADLSNIGEEGAKRYNEENKEYHERIKKFDKYWKDWGR